MKFAATIMLHAKGAAAGSGSTASAVVNGIGIYTVTLPEGKGRLEILGEVSRGKRQLAEPAR
jgi:hypothetical protein